MSGKAGQVVTDVYRDLRDRRLLVIVAALLVAILAVPYLVKGSESTGGGDSTATVVAGAADSNELDPVVLTQPSELRDYRERLSGLKAKNPFEQQLRATATAMEAGGGGGGLATQESAGASTSDTDAGSAATGTTGATTSSASSALPASLPSVDPVSPTEEEPSEEESEEPEPVVEPVLVDFTVDVKVGPVGDARVIRDVEPGSKLPGKERPIVVYLSSEVDASGSTFAVSRDVIGAKGDGHCAPNRAACDFLELEIGQEQELELGSNGETYRLKLLEVNRRERPLPAEASGSE